MLLEQDLVEHVYCARTYDCQHNNLLQGMETFPSIGIHQSSLSPSIQSALSVLPRERHPITSCRWPLDTAAALSLFTFTTCDRST